MSPIRIIRVKQRPPGQEKLLREIGAKLAQFMTPLADAFDAPAMEHCVGCGKVGIFLCSWCKELADAAQRRSDKLMSTVEGRFAQRRFQ